MVGGGGSRLGNGSVKACEVDRDFEVGRGSPHTSDSGRMEQDSGQTRANADQW